MSIDIQGVARLITKLNKLDNLKAKEAVERVADEVENLIVAGASWAPKASSCIMKLDVRDYGKSYYRDIGLRGSAAPFEDWKELWFHNWGYWQYYYGHETGKFTNMHAMWFNNSLANMEKDIIKKIQNDLRKEIKQCLEG